MKLYAHPFSSYCQKVLIALYENDVPFELRLLADDERIAAEHRALWPFARMPVLVDDGRTVVESSIIIEHLALRRPGPVRLIPEDARVALGVRSMDRVFDNYVSTPMQKIVIDWVHPIDAAFPNLRAYRKRLLLRPSFARIVDEARPHRALFPLGAPDRD